MGISGHDFKINYNGYITYFNYPYNGWIVLDSNLMAIDSIQCGNGYEMETNGHDIVMYPDGHTFVFAYNPQIVDMSQIVPGGKPDALVKGLVIQELNSNKEVIFQWRSWDHFLITDATDLDPLTGSIVDPVHGNAMEREADGNLLLSSRNMSEITKINLEPGDIIWRMGQGAGHCQPSERDGEELETVWRCGIGAARRRAGAVRAAGRRRPRVRPS